MKSSDRMRENRKYAGCPEDSRLEWIIAQKGDYNRPVAESQGRTIFCHRTIAPGQIVPCLVEPTTSHDSITNYFATPCESLDVIRSMQVLEATHGSKEDLIQQLRTTILSDLAHFRPHKILSIEADFIDESLLMFLQEQGYSAGNIDAESGRIVYLGTYSNRNGRAVAQTRNGFVYVNNAQPFYVGPVYIGRLVKEDDSGKTFEGFALAFMNRFDQNVMYRIMNLNGPLGQVAQRMLEDPEFKKQCKEYRTESFSLTPSSNAR